MRVVHHIYELIGETPIIQIPTPSTSAKVYLKLEWFNPGGSIKDRTALNMVQDAVKRGILKPGDTIVEPTSGNTGIGLALIAPQFGLKCVIVMPESVAEEKIQLLKAYGAAVVLTSKEQSMNGSIDIADQLVKEKGYIKLSQFDNPANVAIHYQTTGDEIARQIPEITHFILTTGTGGSAMGAGKRLKELKNIRLIGVEPLNSSVIRGNPPGMHKIQGVGPGFIPSIVEPTLFDELRQIRDEDAIQMARRLAKEQGILGGFSTGANVFMALELAKELGPNATIVTVSPSNGERYLSTGLFEEKGS
jgi:cysteine synthase A